MSVTVRDVASKARVSPGTVSRVLNNLDRVKEETREKVRSVMEEMGYSLPPRQEMVRAPIPVRRIQRRALSVKLIGSLRRVFVDNVFASLTHGIEKVMQEDQSHLLVHSIPEDYDPAYAPELIFRRDVDGVLACAGVPQEYFDYIEAKGIPCVRIQTLEPEVARKFTFIAGDNAAMARKVVEHLLALGHRRIAYMSLSPDMPYVRERRDGYFAALAEAGIPIRHEYCVFEPLVAPEPETGARLISRLLALPEPPTAVFAANDKLAVAAMQLCIARGMDIPRQLSFAAYDNNFPAPPPCPALTTIGQPPEQTGEIAAQELLQAIRVKSYIPRKIVAPSRLYLRDSAAPPPGI